MKLRRCVAVIFFAFVVTDDVRPKREEYESEESYEILRDLYEKGDSYEPFPDTDGDGLLDSHEIRRFYTNLHAEAHHLMEKTDVDKVASTDLYTFTFPFTPLQYFQ